MQEDDMMGVDERERMGGPAEPVSLGWPKSGSEGYSPSIEDGTSRNAVM